MFYEFHNQYCTVAKIGESVLSIQKMETREKTQFTYADRCFIEIKYMGGDVTTVDYGFIKNRASKVYKAFIHDYREILKSLNGTIPPNAPDQHPVS